MSEPDLVPADIPTALIDLGLGPVWISGAEVFARCPWHPEMLGREDRHPGSFSVNYGSGVGYCFACQGGGTFVQMVALVRGTSSWDAAGWVLKQGVDPSRPPVPLERVKRPSGARGQAVATAAPKTVDEEVTEASLALYDEPPERELRRRNISREAADYFGVLWDGRKRAWILPIRDDDGVLMGWQEKMGSRVRNRPREVSRNASLFGADVYDADMAVLVESPLDCARLLTADVPGGLSSFGSKVSDEQLRILIRLADRIVLAMDDDDAGRLTVNGGRTKKGRVVRGLVERIGGRARCSLLDYSAAPDAKDPGEMTDRQIRLAIRQAVPAYMAV